MLMKLDPTWLVFAVAAVAMFSYLFSIGLHGALRDAGFGVVGNAGIITVGFFAAIHGANTYGRRFDMFEGMLAGVAGAFALLLLLVLAKAALNRLI